VPLPLGSLLPLRCLPRLALAGLAFCGLTRLALAVLFVADPRNDGAVGQRWKGGDASKAEGVHIRLDLLRSCTLSDRGPHGRHRLGLAVASSSLERDRVVVGELGHGPAIRYHRGREGNAVHPRCGHVSHGVCAALIHVVRVAHLNRVRYDSVKHVNLTGAVDEGVADVDGREGVSLEAMLAAALEVERCGVHRGSLRNERRGRSGGEQ
jgi:hypothetical protein